MAIPIENKIHNRKQQAIVLGLISALFFAFTFVLNRMMSVNGGSWIWSSVLRYVWMLPFFLIIVLLRKNLMPLLQQIKQKPWHWIIWSTVGFGVFYAPLTFAAAYGPSWLVAGTWQVTIVAGILIAPLISNNKAANKLKLSSFTYSGIILLGIVIMQVSEATDISFKELLLGTVPVIIAAFAYPLGNRKMMQITNGSLDACQRILGMIICSIPFWIFLSGFGLFVEKSTPEESQYLQTLVVAIFSGVVATVLFFTANDKVRNDEGSLAAVEATQSAEVLFALVGEVLLLNAHLPGVLSFAGIGLVITGMILHSIKG